MASKDNYLSFRIRLVKAPRPTPDLEVAVGRRRRPRRRMAARASWTTSHPRKSLAVLDGERRWSPTPYQPPTPPSSRLPSRGIVLQYLVDPDHVDLATVTDAASGPHPGGAPTMALRRSTRFQSADSEHRG